MDVDYNTDFSAWDELGISVNNANIIMTSKDNNNNHVLYMKYTIETNAGNLVMYANNQYLYLIDDNNFVVYRYNLGFDMDFVDAIGKGYNEFEESVTAFETGTMTFGNVEYYAEKITLGEEEQIWSFDGDRLKYITYYKNGEFLGEAKVNAYEFKFNESIFTVSQYNMVDTGESIIL